MLGAPRCSASSLGRTQTYLRALSVKFQSALAWHGNQRGIAWWNKTINLTLGPRESEYERYAFTLNMQTPQPNTTTMKSFWIPLWPEEQHSEEPLLALKEIEIRINQKGATIKTVKMSFSMSATNVKRIAYISPFTAHILQYLICCWWCFVKKHLKRWVYLCILHKPDGLF